RPATSVLATFYAVIRLVETRLGPHRCMRISQELMARMVVENGHSVGDGFLRQNIFFEHLFFAVHECVDVVRRELEPMPVRDCVRRARFYAIATENTARI